ncbi:DUF6544 family protein [Roseovarius sp. S4756]|uniref:DUF6544 family protein n=1 Tax=Roseovarius maritimus TaxID=3342637 RepID=UPI003727B919
MAIAVGAVLIFAVALVTLAIFVMLDRLAEQDEWQRLEALQPSDPAQFSERMVADLPEPARRYFSYAIKPGTPLWTVAVIEMTGKFSLGTKEAPGYQPMDARQILCAPDGFVWSMRTTGTLPLSGSDTGRWTRFRVLGLLPVARLGSDRNHTRAAFGRLVAEAAIWSPAALLPGPGVAWTSADEHTARVTVRHGDLSQEVDVTVDGDGRPVVVSFMRWSNANPEKEYRLQPFGAVMSDFRKVGGCRLPFRIEAGNMFGTESYFPFFIADVSRIHFPPPAV